MKVLSNYKDYYDMGMGLGQDQTLIYNRFPKIVEVERPFKCFEGGSYIYERGRRIDGVAVESFCVGFCGKFYSILGLKPVEYTGRNDKESRAVRKLCFNSEDVKNYVRARVKDEQYQEFLSKDFGRRRWWPFGQRLVKFQEFFRELDWQKRQTEDVSAKKFCESWFEGNRCPVIVYAHPEGKRYNQGPFKVILNGCLKDLEFYRLFDSYQAFQEISMWLGNQAEPRKPLPKLDDLTMLEIKGFDKYSFRKQKAG